jgi:tripartite-type tricarboxylate transporter receptor subunit TctC
MKRLAISSFAIVLVTGLVLIDSPLNADPYPNHPIQMIIPMGAGAAGDIAGRLLAEELKKILKTDIVVLNRPGASMVMGSDQVAKSRKDGYTILYTNQAAMVMARALEPENVPYDPLKDFELLGLHMYFPVAIAAPESSPLKSFTDFVEEGKKNPEKIRISSPGINTAASFNIVIIENITGAKYTQIPYKEGVTAINNVLGGHVEAVAFAFSGLVPFATSGKLRLLLTSKKMGDFPNVPTFQELGYKQELPSPWFALYAPAGIPDEAKRVLIPAIKQAVNSPETVARLNKMGGALIEYKSPAELRNLMINEYDAVSAIAKKIGLRR